MASEKERLGEPASFIYYLTDSLYEILNCFFSVTGLSVGIYDNMNNEISYCNHVQRPYCAMIESVLEGKSGCEKLDQDACGKAMEKRSSVTYVCHAGLCETIVPIYLQDFPAGFLVLGQYRLAGRNSIERVREVAANLSLNSTELIRLYETVPELTQEQLENYTKILDVIKDGILSKQLIRFSRADMLKTIMSYISAHLQEDLTAATICRDFGVSHSELYKIFKVLGKTPHTYIHEQRMRCAYDLMISTNLSIAEVCERINCPNYTYFIRSFRERYGVPPGKLRRKNKARAK